jgi:hypothetical protein
MRQKGRSIAVMMREVRALRDGLALRASSSLGLETFYFFFLATVDPEACLLVHMIPFPGYRQIDQP